MEDENINYIVFVIGSTIKPGEYGLTLTDIDTAGLDGIYEICKIVANEFVASDYDNPNLDMLTCLYEYLKETTIVKDTFIEHLGPQQEVIIARSDLTNLQLGKEITIKIDDVPVLVRCV